MFRPAGAFLLSTVLWLASAAGQASPRRSSDPASDPEGFNRILSTAPARVEDVLGADNAEAIRQSTRIELARVQRTQVFQTLTRGQLRRIKQQLLSVASYRAVALGKLCGPPTPDFVVRVSEHGQRHRDMVIATNCTHLQLPAPRGPAAPPLTADFAPGAIALARLLMEVFPREPALVRLSTTTPASDRVRHLGGNRQPGIPWAPVDVLDESKRELLARCESLRSEFMARTDRSCRQDDDCVPTRACVAVNVRARTPARQLEESWRAAGCPDVPACLRDDVRCENEQCRYGSRARRCSVPMGKDVPPGDRAVYSCSCPPARPPIDNYEEVLGQGTHRAWICARAGCDPADVCRRYGALHGDRSRAGCRVVAAPVAYADADDKARLACSGIGDQ